MMRLTMFLGCLLVVALPRVVVAQYSEFYFHPFMEEEIQDPSFEYAFAELPNPERVYATPNVPGSSRLESLTRSWIGTDDEERVLGRKYMEISGYGAVAKWFTLRQDYSTAGHYVTVRAKTEDVNTGALFGINYFDANWNFIEQKQMPIRGSAAGESRGEGDLLKSYTLPVFTPSNATYGQIWIFNSYTGTVTFDFLSAFIDQGTVLRNSFFGFGFDDFASTEFWQTTPGSETGIQYDYMTEDTRTVRKNVLLGQPAKVTNLYQVMKPSPGTNSLIYLLGGFAAPSTNSPHARAWMGIDFFDSASRKIGDKIVDISKQQYGTDLEVFYPFSTPANTEYAIFWFYIEPAFGDERLRIDEIYIEQNGPSSSRLTVAKTTAKRPANAPRSPITPAIARQAASSLKATSPSAQPAIKVPVKKPTVKR